MALDIDNKLVCLSCLHILPHIRTRKGNLVCFRCGHIKQEE